MALFNLTDISFSKEKRGPLQPLVESEYRTNLLNYPEDLGDYGKSHYMVFYVNEQVNTQYSGLTESERNLLPLPDVVAASRFLESQRGPTNIGQIVGSVANLINDSFGNALRTFGQQASTSVSSALNVLVDSPKQRELLNYLNSQSTESLNAAVNSLKEGSFVRKIRRTKDAIALYMPDTLNFSYSQTYSDIATFNEFGLLGTAAAAGVSILDNSKGTGAEPKQSNIASFLVQALKDANIVSGGIGNIGLAALGVASNPGLELLYTSPSFRSFQFDFMFYPRSESEGLKVKQIIDSFKFHQAPEIASRSGGRFLIPPSEFDIKFYYNGQENPNIPKISTCVLEQVDVDYAPNGFAAYEIPGDSRPREGRTGMPVAIRMALRFKETQIVTKEFLDSSTVTVGPLKQEP